MGKGLGIVTRSGTNEPIWVAKHVCIETTQGISLRSYLYLKLAKMPCFFKSFLIFFLLQNWRTRGQNRFCLGVGMEGGRGEVAQIMYTSK
jgi:hypothetical protein